MIVTLDWETHWAEDYTLKSMTTESYVRDARFKAHGMAIKFDAAPARWFPPSVLEVPKMRKLLEESAMLAHHAQFDGLILNHHFGIRPALWLDTLSMARIALPHDRHSLDNLSKLFGLPGKMHQNLINVKGVRDPNAAMLAGLGAMSCDDADKTYAIFQQIKDSIPRDEFRMIDMTIRMFTEPVLQLDEPKMRVYHSRVVAEKGDALAALNLTKKDLGQDETVAAKYRELGVEPDTKTTAKGNTKFAFAKTDQFMRDMLEDEDDRISALTAARLGIKSTLNETRCERLLSMAGRGPLAVYLRYAGAHPTRWSGGDGCLTADTRVVVFDPQKGTSEKHIVDVLLDDLVWDGEEFVAHDGVIFQGFQEVVEYDGITGTPDHKVFTEKGTLALGEARKTKIPIEACPKPKHIQPGGVLHRTKNDGR